MLMRLPSLSSFPRKREPGATLRPAARRFGLRPNDRDSWRLRIAGLFSLSLHAAVFAGLLLWFHHAPPAETSPPVPGAVELVMLEQQGNGAATAPPATAAPSEPAPSAAVPTPPSEPAPPDVPPPDAETADEALPLPPVPPPAAPPIAPQQPSPPVRRAEEAPEINLSGNDSETNAIVTGPDVIPASLDAKSRNREPVYPLEAMRRAQQGAVTLVIHISPAGLPAGVDVAQSSGFMLLDRAARDAVWGWHFLPAVQDGRPIPSDMKMRVVFQLD
jgi:protein TonB